MTVSFHGGHSGRYCDHAGGELETLVLQAIALGFTHYGLSEHMPRTQYEDLYPEEVQRQRTPEQLEHMFASYIREARQLQHKYKEQLHLLVGMETEVTQSSFEDIDYCCSTFNPDFLVGSVHHVSGIPIDYSEAEFERAEAKLGGTEAVYCAYYDAQYHLMQHSRPAVIGHFDLIRMYRPLFPLSAVVWGKIERNLKFAIEYGAFFEVNARAFKKKLAEPYPQHEILQKLLSLGGKITLGDDSHHPDEVGLNFDKLYSFLQTQGVSSYWGIVLSEKGTLEGVEIPLDELKNMTTFM